jgi:hypothetical protein
MTIAPRLISASVSAALLASATFHMFNSLLQA